MAGVGTACVGLAIGGEIQVDLQRGLGWQRLPSRDWASIVGGRLPNDSISQRCDPTSSDRPTEQVVSPSVCRLVAAVKQEGVPQGFSHLGRRTMPPAQAPVQAGGLGLDRLY